MKKEGNMGWVGRRAARLIALAAIPAVIMYLAQPGRDVAAAAQTAAQTERPAANAQSRSRVPIDVDGWLARLKAREIKAESSGEDLFAGTTWQPPPKPVASMPPPPPQMPAFPYQVIGVISVGGNLSLALERGSNAYAVRVGDVIESFRIDRIGENSFVVAHAPTQLSREYRYDQLYPKTPPAPPATAGRRVAPPIIVPPLVVTPRGAQPANPATETTPAAGADASVMVPLGSVVTPAPSLLDRRPPQSTASPSAAPQ